MVSHNGAAQAEEITISLVTGGSITVSDGDATIAVLAVRRPRPERYLTVAV